MYDLIALFKHVASTEASDLFLSVGAPPTIKQDGIASPLSSEPLQKEEAEKLIFSLLSSEEKNKFLTDLEFNKAVDIDGAGRFRINIFRQRGNIAMVARFIKATISTTQDLGLPDLFNELAMHERGLVLIVGAAGSGKTTSLASMIDYRNARLSGHILCIEDPIEIIHSHKQSIVDQREIGLDTHSFDNALRNAMRQAPDMIVIGEIRDYDSMKHALTYAETGHLCMATLHANNATHAIERVLSFYPEEFREQVLLDLSLHLKAIISQRLIPVAAGGRKPAVEMMLNTPFISDLIKHGRIHELREAMERDAEGCMTFDESLLDLFKSGVFTLEEVMEHAESRANLNVAIKQIQQ
ncbi:MAG: type IV pili twitching motility protein PilT [Gammaproteobacteria bacterium]|nr:MAG: type IV pili twitching motility protein PilT [Gammaproteobacteria bacterium]